MFKNKMLILLLVLTFLFNSTMILAFENNDLNSLEFQAENEEDNSFLEDIDRNQALKIGGGVLVLTGGVYFFRRYRRNRNLAELYQEAREYESQQKWFESKEKYEEILEIDKDYENVKKDYELLKETASEYYYNKAVENIEEDNLLKADENLMKSQRMNPESLKINNKIDELKNENVEYLYNRGKEYFRRGEKDKAYQHFQKVYNINPNFRNVQNHLYRIRAEIREVDLYALTFVINNTSYSNLDRAFINELQSELERKEDIYMVDRTHIESIISEQSQALSDEEKENNLKRVNLDVAKMVNADKALNTQLLSLLDLTDIELTVKIFDVKSEELEREIEFEYEFDKEIDLHNINSQMNDLAQELVEEF